MKLNQNSLFAVLLRSPWWTSLLIAAAIVVGLRLFLPVAFAVFGAVPFMVIAAYVGWRELRAPSAARIGRTLERLQAMSWDEFSAAIEEAFRREGYAVGRLEAGADLELGKGGRTTLVACKRWKARTTGIEPLRELEKARSEREAAHCIFVATGEVSAQARAFAAQRSIWVLEGAELVQKMKNSGSGP